MGRQLHERPSNICLVGVDLERHVACGRGVLVCLNILACIRFPLTYRVNDALLADFAIVVRRNSLLYNLFALSDFLVKVWLSNICSLGAWLVTQVVFFFTVRIGRDVV